MDMISAAALILACCAQQGEDGVSLGLRYLARHQAADGSWGRRLRDCGCPAEPLPPAAAADEATRARVSALIQDLDHDDFDRRAQAQKSLIGIGVPATAQLGEAAAGGSAEQRWRSAAALREIGDATTAEDLELTAMAITTFLGAGYSHFSKDVHDDRHFGKVVASGLAWLIARQKADGSFDGRDAAAGAWAALALSEAYGMTSHAPYKEAAQKAIDWIVSHPAADARGLLYQGMALKSAELGELNCPGDAARKVLRAMARKRGAEPFSVFTCSALQILQIFTLKNKQRLDLSGIPGIPVSRMDMERVYVVGMALFQADGPGGPDWKAHNEEAKQVVLALQQQDQGRCERGSFPGSGTRERMKETALATLSREIYYR